MAEAPVVVSLKAQPAAGREGVDHHSPGTDPAISFDSVLVPDVGPELCEPRPTGREIRVASSDSSRVFCSL